MGGMWNIDTHMNARDRLNVLLSLDVPQKLFITRREPSYFAG